MIAFNDVVNLADVHAVLFAKGVWHLTIDFDDHQLRAFNDRALPEIRGAKVEVPAIIHRASLQDGDINRDRESDGNNPAPLRDSAGRSCNARHRVSCGRSRKNAS